MQERTITVGPKLPGIPGSRRRDRITGAAAETLAGRAANRLVWAPVQGRRGPSEELVPLGPGGRPTDRAAGRRVARLARKATAKDGPAPQSRWTKDLRRRLRGG